MRAHMRRGGRLCVRAAAVVTRSLLEIDIHSHMTRLRIFVGNVHTCIHTDTKADEVAGSYHNWPVLIR